MSFEVEMKFHLNDPAPVISLLKELGAVEGAKIEQCDWYFNHPSRDFAVTDEALRIRTVAGESVVTYKGPLVDSLTKTRKEIEVPFGRSESDRERFVEILEHLGFCAVRQVRKTRRLHALTWENREFEIAFDDVADLGTFLEIEIIADESQRESATHCLLRLADKLELRNTERRSYLALLLMADERSPS